MSQLHTLAKANTTLKHEGVGIKITLYQTDIVQTSPEVIRLYTGGWFTATTRIRMNQASNQFNLGYYVKQRKGKWFAEYAGQDVPFDNNGVCTIPRRRLY